MGLTTLSYRQQTHAFLQLPRKWRQLPRRMQSTTAAAVQNQEPLSTIPARSSGRMGVNQYGEQKRNAVMKGQQFKRKYLLKELPFLKDPLKLADHVLGLLRQGEQRKALETVRLATSKMVPCTVSWNHLVDYEMSKGHAAVALKLYNEVRTQSLHMKKLY
ncbi:MAG: hypothetical protein LQ347_003336 [Umbilicaria vellea]|nr:MAG: hypothetical protein LQ347_003336 [Umbilicaria vellea]